MNKTSRRSILKAGAAVTAGAAAHTTGLRSAFAADRAGSKFNWGHTVDFGEQYYSNMLNIMESIRRTEIDLIGDLSDRMAAAIKKGNNVWMQAQAGHMGYIEFKEENKGNPGILRSSTNWGGSDYDKMQPGDVLMTNYVSENVRTARDNGVYVIGVPVNYVDNEWAPRGFVSPNVNDWMLGDVSDVILQSYIPYTQGIVDVPEIPEMKVCPSAGNSLCSLYWMFQAEVANKVKNPSAKRLDYSVRYLDTILDRIRTAYRLQKDAMFDTAAVVAEKIGNGAHYHVMSDHGGVQSEASGVAMGPMMTNAFRRDMKAGDVQLLATIEPDSQTILDNAMNAREMGMFVVSIGPGSFTELRRYSDLYIDNLCPEGGGMYEITGIPQKVATAGGVMNNWLMWIFTSQFVDEMVRRGWVPWFYMGYFATGGPEYCKAMKLHFDRRGF